MRSGATLSTPGPGHRPNVISRQTGSRRFLVHVYPALITDMNRGLSYYMGPITSRSMSYLGYKISADLFTSCIKYDMIIPKLEIL